MPKIAEKKCKKCEQVKPSSDFFRDKNIKSDGLKAICKECFMNTPAKGLENENQINSVIREMAELQANIDHEKALCETRISLVKKYTDEIIEPSTSHQTFLQTMLLTFLKKQKIKRFSRQYRFGVISFSRGKLRLRLDADLAKQMMEKP
ncbi:MAG: hypothetical protein PHQ35_05975 [Phycisphaerae bacterium]|nr:hypothetical protein [Phycisphaerae bacterium]MDD5381274.1 hypothetical protein [Phycisphaerae bacterium]